MPRLTPPIPVHGGKGRFMSSHIHALAEPFRYDKERRPGGWFHRTTPFAGGLGETLSWPHEGISEVAGDIDGRIISFYKVLQGEETFDRFRRLAEVTPFSQALWEEAHSYFEVSPSQRPQTIDQAQQALYLFILIRQSMSKRGDCFSPLTRTRLRGGKNEQVNSWLGAVEGLPEVHERLRRVVFLHQDAVKTIKQNDGANTLFLNDPPYFPVARTAPDVYAHEMKASQHEEFLKVTLSCSAWVMVCGYHCPMYDDYLRNWDAHDFPVKNHSGKGKTKQDRTEVLWTNFTLKAREVIGGCVA